MNIDALASDAIADDLVKNYRPIALRAVQAAVAVRPRQAKTAPGSREYQLHPEFQGYVSEEC